MSVTSVWQTAQDIVGKKEVLAMQLGLFQPGTLVSFCYLGKARLGVIRSTEPQLAPDGQAFINAQVSYLDNPELTAHIRRESEMCVIMRNVFDLADECRAKIKEIENAKEEKE